MILFDETCAIPMVTVMVIMMIVLDYRKMESSKLDNLGDNTDRIARKMATSQIS